jgi:glycosidase
MKNTQLELLVEAKGIGTYRMVGKSVGTIKVLAQKAGDNPDYLFILLDLGRSKPGKYNFELKDQKSPKLFKFSYELKARRNEKDYISPVSPADVVYLVFPDRFSNGDTKNDVFPKMHEKTINRDSMYHRHGGDLQGIINHLDYFEELGVSAVWLNPVFENDEPKTSYHGYAITDHYNVDPRLGNNEQYAQLGELLRKRNLKLVKDVIFNHIGDKHRLYAKPPFESWIHRFPTFTKTNYRAPSINDPYASERDRSIFSDGWFDFHMPDLNQKDPYLARYLIQNTIWWVEMAGIDGLRIDTYSYPDLNFMDKLCEAVLNEYPGLYITGEIWEHSIPVQSYFTQNIGDGGARKLPCVKDFQLYFAMTEALNKEQGWTEGVSRIYYTLSGDYVYKNPFLNLTFLDNHDLSRIYSVVGENPDKMRQALVFLLTMRGVPSIYYGTEILLKNFCDPDGKVRQDFPGGWAEDKVNKFKVEGRTEDEQAIFTFTRDLIQFRKAHKALQDGKLMQFIPEKGAYVYFRYNDKETIMMVFNTSKNAQELNLDRFEERTGAFKKAKNALTGERLSLAKGKTWSLKPHSADVYVLER